MALSAIVKCKNAIKYRISGFRRRLESGLTNQGPKWSMAKAARNKHTIGGARKGSRMFKHTQYRANGTEQDDLANDKASTLAVLADNEQWVADNYNKTITISEQDRSKCAALTAEEDTVLDVSGLRLLCNGIHCRLSCKESCSTMPATWASCWILLP